MLHIILVGAVGMGALLLFVVLPVNFVCTPRLSRGRTRAARTPRVSVVIPVYNGERFLPQQLASIQQQTRLPDEVVVCDDRSNDRTVARLWLVVFVA